MELVEYVLKIKFRDFFRIINWDSKWLYELVDILVEIEVIKEDLNYFVLLLYFDLLFGINLIVNKLLFNI